MSERRAKANKQMNKPLQPPQGEAISKLAEMFKSKQTPYTPVSKSLKAIELEPLIMDVNIDDKLVECFVIPVQDLIYREWRYMTQSELAIKPQNERPDNGITENPDIPSNTVYFGPECDDDA